MVQVVQDEGSKEIGLHRGSGTWSPCWLVGTPWLGFLFLLLLPPQFLFLHPRPQEPTGLRHFFALTSVHFRFTLWESKGS